MNKLTAKVERLERDIRDATAAEPCCCPIVILEGADRDRRPAPVRDGICEGCGRPAGNRIRSIVFLPAERGG